ncbi:MAG: sigma 54-interacting transcriptional regulator [Desulfobulbaceae bacterium]|jgi:PAS domain S-box-containing protein|nr:sigma 54-interacting transcriptional regulator [Desulfobulbaceae bacterium]
MMKKNPARVSGKQGKEADRDERGGWELPASFRDLFFSLPDAAALCDAHGRILQVNPALENIFGFTADELVGQQAGRLQGGAGGEEPGKWQDNGNACSGADWGRSSCRRGDGSVFPAEVAVIRIRDDQGDVRGFVHLFRDLSGQREREKELLEAQMRYRLIADYTSDWEYWRDANGSFRYVSPSCERITGYPPAAFVERPALVHEIVLPADREIWEGHCRDSMEEMKRREVQFRIVRRDGEVRWIEHACQPVVADSGKVLGFRVSNRDVTRRKTIENELRQALEAVQSLKEHLEAESLYLKEEIALEHDYTNIIGNSNALQYVLFKVEQIAASDTTVLILGETGTGKELIARAIHSRSARGGRSLVKVDCASLPADLIESELFGHEKGAFTGAHARHIGRFELADGTSIFLDEIGELPLELQAKLLRVIQDGEFERVGGNRTIRVDVRVIAATNRNLEEDVRQGKFRMDLWYRLNVYPLTVPSLRDRGEDIPLLVNHFVNRFAHKQGKKINTVPRPVMEALRKYPWPGNIRELENVIERAVINTTGTSLRLPEGLREVRNGMNNEFKTLRDMEREYILKVLDKTGWKVSGANSAAEILGMDRSTLRARMKKLNIRKP